MEQVEKLQATDPIQITVLVLMALNRLAAKEDRFYTSKEIHAQVHTNVQANFELDFELMEKTIQKIHFYGLLCQLKKPSQQDPLWCLMKEKDGMLYTTAVE